MTPLFFCVNSVSFFFSISKINMPLASFRVRRRGGSVSLPLGRSVYGMCMGCMGIRKQRAPAGWNSYSWNDWMGSRLSPNRGSHSSSKLAWRLQEKNRSSCLLSARMWRWSPSLFLIQGCAAWNGQVTQEVAASPIVSGHITLPI